MISIIIPAYNRSFTIVEAVKSVLTQTYWNRHHEESYELLIIDDGSTDKTQQTLAPFAGKLRYHYQEHRGISAARNQGLKLARGEFIAFLDSDDLWKEEKINIQMNYMKAFPQAKICCTEETWIRNGVFVNPRKKHAKPSGWIFDKVLPLCLLSLSSALFRKEVFQTVGSFDESLPACEDYDFCIRLAFRYPITFLSNALIVKRGGHADQLSHKYWGMDRFRIMSLEKNLSLPLSREQKNLVRREIVKKSRVLAQGAEKRGKKKLAEYYTSLAEKYG
ncbi:MAG: glycosyltransferase family 2 protein [Candidatus Aminicenantes bacterium]|nr:glycosyltransferase family 2 protein [Candidatus Aminicenantes bacterium]